ncbi:MAG: SGNH/GDSL hydrolase family protein [Planctomycetota bacterium]
MPTSNLVYVALGDSISIDDYAGGPGCGAASLLHKNLPHFPEFEGRDLATRFPGIRLELLAADGAKAPDVADMQLYHLSRVEGEILLCTVTCGGNDLLGIYGADLQVGEVAAQDLRLHLDEILAEVRRAAGPDCLLIVGNIYDPTDGTGDPELFGGVEWPDGIPILHHFNEAIEDVALDHDAALVDIHAHFLGHGCAADDPDNPLHNPDDPTLWYEQVIEPNARGASEVRRLFWLRVEEHLAP